ncbi:hypothetical protein [Erythrobacter mangrovi]|uniref:Transposase n=1 Tax=Erythrobacter mangrovi TaxID=2739433 RepID=A0A7D4B984_9SPHN|nr:hypothetical protein [Erythrobacter mangrovi]QKG72563.1 hypothetical protein HQR01_14985 [Erythrobacter mangrovi]
MHLLVRVERGQGGEMPRKKKPVSPFRYFNSSPEAITTDGLRSYKAAMGELGSQDKQAVDSTLGASLVPDQNPCLSHVSWRIGIGPVALHVRVRAAKRHQFHWVPYDSIRPIIRGISTLSGSRDDMGASTCNFLA